MDEELFKLCKEVYKRTDWAISKSDKGEVGSYDSRIKYYSVNGFMQDSPFNDSTPQYTSDYILEKLEESHYQLRVEHNHSDMTWYAYFAGKNIRQLFDDEKDWDLGADTPLKALLKLVIALDNAKELSNG